MTTLTLLENAKQYIEYTFDKDVEIEKVDGITYKVKLADGCLFVEGLMFDEVRVYNYDLGINDFYKLNVTEKNITYEVLI